MRKRSKKRIPQDIKAWHRISHVDENILSVPSKKNARWTSGSRRDRDTRILNAANKVGFNSLIRTALTKALIKKQIHDYVKKREKAEKTVQPLIKTDAEIFATQITALSKTRALSKYKNFCLFSGRGRTYNRALLIARHHVRKLTSVGLLSGLLK